MLCYTFFIANNFYVTNIFSNDLFARIKSISELLSAEENVINLFLFLSNKVSEFARSVALHSLCVHDNYQRLHFLSQDDH